MDVANDLGTTALMCASLWGRADVVRIVLEAGKQRKLRQSDISKKCADMFAPYLFFLLSTFFIVLTFTHCLPQCLFLFLSLASV